VTTLILICTHALLLRNSFNGTVFKVLAATIWLIAIGYTFFLLNHLGLAPLAVTIALFSFLSTSWYGLILFVLMHAVRPLTLFPASILGVLAGIFFGFTLGVTLTILGTLLASAVAYGVGRFFSYPTHTSAEVAELSSWKRLLRSRTFEASIILHLSFLPFDAVNYFSGIMRVPFFQFLTGTILGTLPGLISYVSIGASIDLKMFIENGFTLKAIDPKFILLAGTILVSSLLFSNVIRAWKERVRRESK
jgi:uncharacterized membrane protein YdjX (TVP38/TMEM64 family)